MATTSKSAGTRKTSTTRATGSTSTSKGDADTTTTEPAAEDTAEDTASEPTTDAAPGQAATADDPAAALKAKLRTTQHIGDVRADELTDEQRMNLVGAPSSTVGGPRTLSSPSIPTRRGEEYVTAENDGYVAFLPDRIKQPTTVKVWVKDQRVRKDMFDALSGLVTQTAAEAKVLDGDEYTRVAPFL